MFIESQNLSYDRLTSCLYAGEMKGHYDGYEVLNSSSSHGWMKIYKILQIIKHQYCNYLHLLLGESPSNTPHFINRWTAICEGFVKAGSKVHANHTSSRLQQTKSSLTIAIENPHTHIQNLNTISFQSSSQRRMYHSPTILTLPLLLAVTPALADWMIYQLDISTCTITEGLVKPICNQQWFKGAMPVAEWFNGDCSKQPNPVTVSTAGLGLELPGPLDFTFDPPICGNSDVTFETAGGDQWIAVGEDGSAMGICTPVSDTGETAGSPEGDQGISDAFCRGDSTTETNIYAVEFVCVSDTCS